MPKKELHILTFSDNFIINQAELLDVQGANDDNMPIKEVKRHQPTPHQLPAIQLLQLSQDYDREEET